MKLSYSMAMGAAAALAAPAFAADATLKLELPQLSVAEYHKPYVAVWVEKASDQGFASNVALWYDLKKRDNGGAKWLKDMRTWWRKSGRELQTPIDGVTAATRAPGEHVIGLSAAKGLAALPPGNYQLVVEAARENGGREVVRLPFDWPVKAPQTAKAQGEHELGAVALELKP
ncbi:DUF2271 domain-containing protein [Rhizobacter sp. SG703]|uniref:DUF2271 domain-containing protein n=1 Tax=Rhizobacter sp. SG703 TaxID=2587140 RepID=UPI001444EEE6|nr:DUF2271 domain-containing protein [Rhizobacter sp. SG703]NKI94447.1 hypothetical protein [Rhizobacter sp. SG703]